MVFVSDWLLCHNTTSHRGSGSFLPGDDPTPAAGNRDSRTEAPLSLKGKNVLRTFHSAERSRVLRGGRRNPVHLIKDIP